MEGNLVKSLMKRLIRQVGFDLRRHVPVASATVSRMAFHNVNLVLDVGANSGQFGESLCEAGYEGRIVSFEPLSTAHKKLLEISQQYPMWDVAERVAIGSEDGEIEIHVSDNSVSSSVLNMLDAHVKAAPKSTYVGSERVPLRRLDSIAGEYIREDSVTFLKIDTQGYEDRVLKGSDSLLNEIVGVQLELSLVPLYADQRLYDELIDYIRSRGFLLWGVEPGFADRVSGRTLQIDATFFRGGDSY